MAHARRALAPTVPGEHLAPLPHPAGEWLDPEHTEQVKAAVRSATDRLANGGRPTWDGSGAEGAAPRVRSGSGDWS